MNFPVSHKDEGGDHLDGGDEKVGDCQGEKEVVGDGPHGAVCCSIY